MSEPDSVARDLMRRFSKLSNFDPRPDVVRRLAALLIDGDRVEYADSDWGPNGQSRWQVVVISKRRVLHATGEGLGDGPVQVTAWSRSSLVRMSLPGDDARNPSHAWSNLTNEGDLPSGAVVSLRYAERGEPLALPLHPNTEPEQRAELAALLPGLLADLG